MDDIAELDRVISRSDEFESELIQLFQSTSFPNINKSKAILAMNSIALEHACSLRLLAKNGLHTSAMGVLRLQYEAVVRAVWVLYAASDIAINKLVAPLTPETERAARNGLPGSSTMLSDIEKKGPPGVHRLLNEFKDYSSQALNSFIHSGIHAVNRHLSGYPAILFSTAIRQSNNLTHMSAIAIACLLENPGLVTSLGKIGNKYADCLQLK